MPRFEEANWGDITNHIFVKGIITVVYPEDDTADVTVPGYQNGTAIPLFYHCSDDAEERDNGALEGAAAAFSAGTEADPDDGDEVIVMVDATTGVPIRIIGFVDGIKSCIWEPWNTQLCDNHTWSIDYPYFTTTECLDLPVAIDIVCQTSTVNITKDVTLFNNSEYLYADVLSKSGKKPAWLQLQWIYSSSDSLERKKICKIKYKAQMENCDQVTQNIRLGVNGRIYDYQPDLTTLIGGYSEDFVLAWGNIGTSPHDPDYTPVGTNEFTEQTLELTLLDYIIPESVEEIPDTWAVQITQVYLLLNPLQSNYSYIYYTGTGIEHAEIYLDYITFE